MAVQSACMRQSQGVRTRRGADLRHRARMHLVQDTQQPRDDDPHATSSVQYTPDDYRRRQVSVAECLRISLRFH